MSDLDLLALLGAPVPPQPANAAGQRASVPLRFEDLTQDGRVVLSSLLPGLGRTAWAHLLSQPLAGALRAQGIIPILTRFVAVGQGGPFGVAAPLEARGHYAFGQNLADSGAVSRLLVGMWLETRGKLGSVYGAPPDAAGSEVSAGRIYAEHVLTKPWADAAQRRVLSLPPGSLPDGEPSTWTAVHPESVLDIPPEVQWLDPAPAEDPAVLSIGIAHTDPNRHTNSMVYVRWFEEAGLRRLAVHGRREPLLVRAAHVAFRKPSFAGQRLRVWVRCFEAQGKVGAVGSFLPDDSDRPSALLAVVFET